jgi:hypothetical protein
MGSLTARRSMSGIAWGKLRLQVTVLSTMSSGWLLYPSQEAGSISVVKRSRWSSHLTRVAGFSDMLFDVRFGWSHMEAISTV